MLKSGFTRINELSDALNVHPPSATRMVQRLGKQDLLKYEKYGVIVLKDEGKILGEFLLKRHNIIETFLKKLGVPEEVLLVETEKIEHTISENTTKCFENFIGFMDANKDVEDRFHKYKMSLQ